MQKTKQWKHVEYDSTKKTAPQAEASHLEHVHAGELSHEHMMHKHKMHKKMIPERTVLYAPVEPTSAFTWHNQDALLGDGVGLSQRVRARAQVVANGFA